MNTPAPFGPVVWVGLGCVAAALVWSHWSTLGTFLTIWSENPQYSHGFLVPGFALVLLWLRRGMVNPSLMRPSLVGLAVLVLGLTLRMIGVYFYLAWPERIALLPVVAGLCLALGGWHGFRWAWPSIAFLFFMIPLPGGVETLLAGPLQRVATLASTNVLQTLGFFAYAEGNIIVLSDAELEVVEACSGLRMFFTFLALSAAVAILIRRPVWQRVAVVLSAGPVALFCNVVRISATGVLHETAGREVAHAVFHDLAGWLMMVLALGLLWAELKLLSALFIAPAGGPQPPGVVGSRLWSVDKQSGGRARHAPAR